MATLNTFTQKVEFTLSNKNLKEFSDKYPTPFYDDDSNFICPSLNNSGHSHLLLNLSGLPESTIIIHYCNLPNVEAKNNLVSYSSSIQVDSNGLYNNYFALAYKNSDIRFELRMPPTDIDAEISPEDEINLQVSLEFCNAPK